MKKLVVWTVCGLMVMLVSGLLIWSASQFRFSREYQIHAQYRTLPENDDELRSWLRTQKGVVRSGMKREGRQITVFFIIAGQNLTETDPPTPDIRSALSRMGYEGEMLFVWDKSDLSYGE
jgi:hypothetical protein